MESLFSLTSECARIAKATDSLFLFACRRRILVWVMTHAKALNKNGLWVIADDWSSKTPWVRERSNVRIVPALGFLFDSKIETSAFIFWSIPQIGRVVDSIPNLAGTGYFILPIADLYCHSAQTIHRRVRDDHSIDGRTPTWSKPSKGALHNLFQAKDRRRDSAPPHHLPLQDPVFQARSSCK